MLKTRQHERHNFPSSYPSFHPHITLASFPSASAPSLSAIRTAIGAPESQPLPVKFKSIDIGTHFFRSVYIAITPTPALEALHARVHTKLGIEPRTPSFPHVSLCYIDDADALGGERERFLEELREQGRIRYGIDGDEEGPASVVSLRCGDGVGDLDWMGEFGAGEIWVAKCDGPVKSWTILDKISIA